MEISKEDLRVDALNLVYNLAQQRALGAARDRFGLQASAVDEYEHFIRKIMSWSGITVDDARQVLDGFEAPHVNDVLEALTRIELELKKQP